MNELDLPPLDDEVHALLRRASRVGGAPAAAKVRVIARIDSALGARSGGGGSSIARPLGPMVATFLVGGALGAAGMYAAMRALPSVEAARVVYVDRVVAATPPPANAAVVPSVAASNSSEALRLPSARSTRSAAVPLSESSPTSTLSRLNAERILLDAARGAIEREDGLAALAALEQHERKYPSGVLVQEREAMAIRALVMLGRTTDAMARARRFRARFPDSALLPSIDSIVQALPAP